MGSIDEKRKRFKAQIAELYRLADEAESCATLLRQQAQSQEEVLEDENLTEEKLDEFLAEKPERRFAPNGAFIVTEGLM
jgi:hypothetical protein